MLALANLPEPGSEAPLDRKVSAGPWRAGLIHTSNVREEEEEHDGQEEPERSWETSQGCATLAPVDCGGAKSGAVEPSVEPSVVGGVN